MIEIAHAFSLPELVLVTHRAERREAARQLADATGRVMANGITAKDPVAAFNEFTRGLQNVIAPKSPKTVRSSDLAAMFGGLGIPAAKPS